MKVRLKEVAALVSNKAKNNSSVNNYVSTENMKPNRGGITFPASSIPSTKTINTYTKGDILVSNIRPYFKKIWKANIDGTRSNDVLCFRTKSSKLLQDFLFFVLQTDTFFEYVMKTSKGTKMPRGDKEAILDYRFNLPDISKQKNIVKNLNKFDQKIQLNSQINQNLFNYCKEQVSKILKTKSTKKAIINNSGILVTDHVANGSFKSLKDNVNYFDTPKYALFLRNIDFKNNLDGNLKYIDKSSYDYLQKTQLHGGEVVISNVADVGSVHRVPYLKIPMVLGNNQIVLKSSNQLLLDYLYIFFNSFEGKNAIYKITSGSAQQKFNKTDFRKIELKIPNNLWIKKHISPFLSGIDILKKENTTLMKLKQILLNKYFRNQL